jgi:hypothetical protein
MTRGRPSLRFGEADLRLAADQLGELATFEALLVRVRDNPKPTERRAYNDLIRRLDAELRAGITVGKYGLRLRRHTTGARLCGVGNMRVDQSYRPFDEVALAELSEYMAAHPEQCTQAGVTAWARSFIRPYDRDKAREAARKLPEYHREKRGPKPKR